MPIAASWVDDGAVVAAQYCVGARTVLDVGIVEHPNDSLGELSVDGHNHFARTQGSVIVGPMDGHGYALVNGSAQVGQYGHSDYLSVYAKRQPLWLALIPFVLPLVCLVFCKHIIEIQFIMYFAQCINFFC